METVIETIYQTVYIERPIGVENRYFKRRGGKVFTSEKGVVNLDPTVTLN